MNQTRGKVARGERLQWKGALAATLRTPGWLWGLALEETAHAPKLPIALLDQLLFTQALELGQLLEQGRLQGFRGL